MKLEGTWCTEDIDKELLHITGFSGTQKFQSFKTGEESYVVFLESGTEVLIGKRGQKKRK